MAITVFDFAPYQASQAPFARDFARLSTGAHRPRHAPERCQLPTLGRRRVDEQRALVREVVFVPRALEERLLCEERGLQ